MSSQYFERLSRTIKQHEDWRLRECLNLIPSENRGSSEMRSMFLNDLGNRYTAPDRFYRGTKYLDELQTLVEEMARKVFNARYADVRPLSGHIANLAVLLSFAQKEDRVLSVSPDNGGYPGVGPEGLGRLLGLKNVYFPYDDVAVNIDPAKAAAEMRKSPSSLTIFGASFIPFPHPVRQLTEGSGAPFVYDGSHVLGLIAGGEFQDPLREGCSLLYGSTHKSFPGPQGGILLSNDADVFSKVSGQVFPGVVDNFHLNRVAALAVALAEMMQFGKAYAGAVVKNAQTLARSLVEEGVRVRGSSQGYTKSHQVLLDYESSKLQTLASRLEQANIISDNGGRLGTSEVTRMGYGPAEMETVAELVSLVVLGKKPADFVQKRVKSLVKQFQQPRFVLKPGKPLD